MNDPLHVGGHARLDFISSLRGWAALYVALLHLTFNSHGAVSAPDWLRPAISFGGTAVTLFFVLSAFTLAMSMDTRREDAPVRNFFIRRFFRIAPLFYVWVIGTALIGYWLFGVSPTGNAILLNVLFLFNLAPGYEWSLAYSGWSIGTEMLFYVLFPLVFATSRSLKSSLAWLIATIAVAQAWRIATGGISYPYPYTSIVNQMPVFIIGVIAYHLYRTLPRSRILGLWLIAAAFGGFWLLAYPFEVKQIGHSLYLRAAFCAALILGLGMAPIRAMVNPPLVFAGNISYSIYLTHAAACLLVERAAPFVYGKLPALVAYPAMFGLLLVIVIPVSYVSFLLIEKPGIRMGDRIIKSLPSSGFLRLDRRAKVVAHDTPGGSAEGAEQDQQRLFAALREGDKPA
ncbi:acyltransferase family protein [Bordetella genomosp. 8]|nr:acyltransferase [Bordetella genomosp. 8]